LELRQIQNDPCSFETLDTTGRFLRQDGVLGAAARVPLATVKEAATCRKSVFPIPPAGRSNKGPGPADADRPSDAADERSESHRRNVEKQGRQGNINVNTTNPGYQQDR